MQKPERRVEPRAEVDAEVRYHTAQELTAAYIRNISGVGSSYGPSSHSR
jgi:hypothetical protein